MVKYFWKAEEAATFTNELTVASVATVDLPAAAPSLANVFMVCCGVKLTAIQRGPTTTK